MIILINAEKRLTKLTPIHDKNTEWNFINFIKSIYKNL